MGVKVPEIKSQKLFFTVSFDENGGRQIIICVSNREQSLFQVHAISEVGCLEFHCFQNAEKRYFCFAKLSLGVSSQSFVKANLPLAAVPRRSFPAGVSVEQLKEAGDGGRGGGGHPLT